MQENRPTSTLAELLVVCISPVLIMLLVGSLCFFLIEIFGHGEALGSLRWVMFWFVMAIVLVSRIGIEQGKAYAMGYGLALAAATGMYLMRIFPAFILGIFLLGIVWWSAHKLVWDCTLINEDEDASGSGLLQSAADSNIFTPQKTNRRDDPDKKINQPTKSATPHSPGLWVVYFSLAALPLFGIGQMLLPADDPAARHTGFNFLFIYMGAAFGLLIATSFLGLRRYLRQRYLQMPATIAYGWVRFGVSVAGFILIGALLLPRPGATDTWLALRHQVDYRLQQASDYAMRFSPHGAGKGRPGNGSPEPNAQNRPAAKPQPDNQTGSGKSTGPRNPGSGQSQNPSPQTPSPTPFTNPLYGWFKILFFLALALLFAWWIFRQHNLILQAIKSIIGSIADFFRNLFGFRFSKKTGTATTKKTNQVRHPFAAFQNPFLAGKEGLWTQAQLVLYSYEALRAWAEKHGIEPRPEQTAREFCIELSNRFPEINQQLYRLSIFYGRTAYGFDELANQNLEPLKELWRYFYTGGEGGI